GTISESLAAGQYNLEDLRVRCETYVETIREQARQILIDAQKEAEQLKLAAVQQGLQQGLQQGQDKAAKGYEQKLKQESTRLVNQRLQQVIPALQGAVSQFQEQRDQSVAHWQQQAIFLSLAIAEKLVHRSLQADPQIARERIADVLSMVIGQSELELHLAVEDLAPMEDQLSELTGHLRAAQISLVEEPSLQSGECLVRTKYGEIDARIETQLNRIADELLGSE
ncbi:MAG: hypothetical protein KDA78_18850, partial [Planctomycetaceae bacterium]|nr:hypothetical protein [Planctomycetaceae bacterium]